MGDKLNMLLFLGKMLSSLFAKAPSSLPMFSNHWPTWGAIMAGLSFGRKGSPGGFVPTGQGIWVDLTENRQMVLQSYGAKNRDELETPESSDKAEFMEMSTNHGKRRRAHHLEHHWTELSCRGEKRRALMGQSAGFCLYLKKTVNTS